MNVFLREIKIDVPPRITCDPPRGEAFIEAVLPVPHLLLLPLPLPSFFPAQRSCSSTRGGCSPCMTFGAFAHCARAADGNEIAGGIKPTRPTAHREGDLVVAK